MDSLNIKSQNQAENIPVVLPCSPIKIWGKSVKVLLSYDRTYKQTNEEYNFIYSVSQIKLDRVNGSKLRFEGQIRKFEKNESFWTI